MLKRLRGCAQDVPELKIILLPVLEWAMEPSIIKFESCLDVLKGGALCALPALLFNGHLHGAHTFLGEVNGYYQMIHIFPEYTQQNLFFLVKLIGWYLFIVAVIGSPNQGISTQKSGVRDRF